MTTMSEMIRTNGRRIRAGRIAPTLLAPALLASALLVGMAAPGAAPPVRTASGATVAVYGPGCAACGHLAGVPAGKVAPGGRVHPMPGYPECPSCQRAM